jgi:acyl dehydratase
MKTLAAILRDPNVIHIDRDLVSSRGLGDKLINQGPINLGYVTNMLEAAFGAGSIARLRVRFGSNVFEDDVVTAGGSVTEVGDTEVTCEVWLQRQDGTRAVEGTAVVRM